MASADELSLVQENIDEFVNDENKIVTCKWLSLSLNLQINTAKRALYTFVERQRKGKDSNGIHVTYFVAGLGKSKSGELEHKCVVVPETDLDAVKKALLAVTSCHIYSVQKAKLKDYTALYQTDYDVIKQNLEHCSRLGSIKCDWVTQRVVRQPAAATEKLSSAQKTEKNESPTTGATTSSYFAAKTNNTKKAEPKGRIASMFAAATATAGQKKAEEEVATAALTKASDKKTAASAGNKAKPTQKKGGVQSFFNMNGTSKKTPSQNGSSKQAVEKEKEEETAKIAKMEESDEEPDRKRRKRIRTDLFDSSESEEEDEPEDESDHRTLEQDRESPILFVSENKDDVEEKDHSANAAKEDECSKPLEVMENGENTSNISNGGGQKRKREKKTVTKQYQDEEGFLVTKKEVVWESESDNSEAEEVAVIEEPEEVAVIVEEEAGKAKPNSAAVKQNKKPLANHKTEAKGKKVPKKGTSPQKGKQTSLTSFFKKK